MKRTLVALLAVFAVSSTTALAGGQARDLCAEVYRDLAGNPVTDSAGRTISRYCEPSSDELPTWEDELCCTFSTAGASCTPTSDGRCERGEKMWCEHGEQIGEGVTCYFYLPDTCDLGHCDPGPIEAQPIVDETLLCCQAGACYEVINMFSYCAGDFSVCRYGETNEDGTTTCHDYGDA